MSKLFIGKFNLIYTVLFSMSSVWIATDNYKNVIPHSSDSGLNPPKFL